MVTCWRCGVDFDGAPYLAGAPCPDCQEEFDGDFFSVWTQAGIDAAKERDVRKLHAQGMSDREIGDVVGVPRNSIFKIRKRMGLPANAQGGAQHWKDYEGTIAYLRSPQHARNIIDGQADYRKRGLSHKPEWKLY